MKKFKFNLEKVLNYRKRRTEKALASFQEQLSLVHKQKGLLQSLEAQVLEALQQNQDKVSVAGPSSHFLQFNSELTQGLRSKIKRETVKLREMQVVLEDRQAVLIELRKEQRALELLREKKKAEFKKEVLHKEQKLIDDLVVMRQSVKGEP